jgi:signal transduction histidine kinase/CheY-like chemotaxis protein/PAS domain-containing protein
MSTGGTGINSQNPCQGGWRATPAADRAGQTAIYPKFSILNLFEGGGKRGYSLVLMRRQTDFVLEKAAWPALLLEESGAICRANRAACQLFGTAVQGGASLSALLDDGNGLNGVKLDRFLADLEAAGKPGEMKLACAGGQKTRFVSRVTKLSREGRNYFVLQLFGGPAPGPSETAAAAARAKEPPAAQSTALLDAMEVPFALTNADWPALVADKAGAIIRSNPAAARVFGAASRKGALLGVIWAAENAAPLEKWLAEPAQGDAAPVKLRAESGTVISFHARICPAAQTKWVLLQFFKEGGSAGASPSQNVSGAHRAPLQGEGPGSAGASPSRAPLKMEGDFLLQEADWPALLLRKNGQVLRANRAAARAFGSNIEKPDFKLGMIWSPENRESLEQFLALPAPATLPRLKFRLKSGLPASFLAQVTCLEPDDICLLQLLKEPAPDEGGPMAGGPGAAAIPAAMEARFVQRQKLDCALQLARSVALDFNNALTSILGHASLLLSKAPPDHPWRGSLVEIEKSADKAAEVAADLASFSRQEKDARAQTAGNLNTLLERTVEALQNSLDHPVAISRHLERKLFTANFDEAKMQQALVRILENAVEAIPADGQVTVETRNLELTEPREEGAAKLSPGNYVCVEVSDNGPGIAAEVMPHLFEPFFTTKGSRHRGLGLAWVYGIVTNHGGGVAVSSPPGAGATVRIYLPANDKIVREAPLTPAELRGMQTVLMVDDEDLLLTMGQMVLSSFGYTVLTANSGAKALDLFAHWKDSIDLVLVDLVMPNMSGRELTEQIRKIAPHARILWCSGYVRSSPAEEEDPYLQKPFTSQDLLRAVKSALAEAADGAPAPASV